MSDNKLPTKGERITALVIVVGFLIVMGLLVFFGAQADVDNMEWMMP